MPTIALIGDVHLRARNLRDTAAAWRRALERSRDAGADLVVQAGDVFDNFNVCGREAATGTVYDAFLSPVLDVGLPLVITIGNHDMGPPSEVDALGPVDKYGNITVLRDPGVFRPLPGLAICAIPWVNRAALVARMLARGETPADAARRAERAVAGLLAKASASAGKAREDGDLVLLVGHMEVTGAARDNGQPQSGGSFEHAPASLARVGAHAYALAHLHKRQAVPGLPGPNDGYLGALCQQNFGEAGNPDGFRLLSHDGQRITSDEFVPGGSPRHVVATTVEQAAAAPAGSRVKLRCAERPADLPEGVVFEKEQARAEAPRRAGGALSSDEPTDGLLAAWHAAAKPDVPLDRMLGMLPDLGEADDGRGMGALDLVERVTVQNLTCHEDTDVDLSGVRGLCALEGANGSGKTSFVEAVILGLFGFCPTRPSLASMVSSWRPGGSLVEVSFRSGGAGFVARRELNKTNKTFSHKAHVLRDGEPLAGPGVDDANARCETIVGPAELLLASTFAPQRDAEHLVDLRPAERKELVARMLGTDRFLPLADKARAIAQAGKASADALEEEKKRLGDELAALGDAPGELARLGKAVEEARAGLAGKRAAAETATGALARAEAMAELAREAAAKRARREEIKREGKAARDERDRLAATDPGAAEKRHSEWLALRDRLAAAKGEFDKGRQLLREAEAVEASIQAAWFEARDKVAERLAALERRRNEAVEKAVAERNDAHAALLDAENDLGNAKRRAGLLSGFPDADVCRACPLARDGIKAKSEIEGLAAKRDAAEKELRGREARVKEVRERAAAKEAEIKAQSPGEDDWMPERRAEVKRLRDQSISLASPAAHDKIEAMETELRAMGDPESSLGEARDAKARMARLDGVLQGLRDEHKRLGDEVRAAEERLAGAPDPEAARAALDAARKAAGEAEAGMAALERQAGAAGERAEEAKRKEKRLGEASSGIEEARAREATARALAAALGRDGIPQLVFDNVIPRMHEIMASLLESFGGRWTMEVRSQRPTSSGKGAQERVDIVVDDGNGERDVSTYSGGELKLLKSVLRIAFSLLQAERGGGGVKVLVLDEAMDQMDSEYASMFLAMLESLPGKFNQVFVVSHDDALVHGLPNRIRFERDSLSSPTRVTVTTTAPAGPEDEDKGG